MKKHVLRTKPRDGKKNCILTDSFNSKRKNYLLTNRNCGLRETFWQQPLLLK